MNDMSGHNTTLQGDGEPQMNYQVLGLFGPHRVGKSSTLNHLEEHNGDKFERGKKHKFRHPGGAWSDDGKAADSIPVRSKKSLEQLQGSGKIAFTYQTVDTLHLVPKPDSKPKKHLVYISDSVDGAFSFNNYFGERLVSFLMYADPSVLERRLINSNIPEEQIRRRLANFKQEFAAFKDYSKIFTFLLYSSIRPIDETIVLDETAEDERARDIKAVTDRIIKLFDFYVDNHKPGENIEQFHQRYIDEIAYRLSGHHLSDLPRVTRSGHALVDLESELRAYTNEIPDDVRKKLAKVPIVDYVSSNGRHSILLRGLRDPYDHSSKLDADDLILELIAKKLGANPTRGRNIRNRGFDSTSHYGLTRVDHGLLRDGALYSLGDQLVGDLVHSALSISFFYPPPKSVFSSKVQPQFRGLTMDEIVRLLENPATSPDINPNGVIKYSI